MTAFDVFPKFERTPFAKGLDENNIGVTEARYARVVATKHSSISLLRLHNGQGWIYDQELDGAWIFSTFRDAWTAFDMLQRLHEGWR